MRIGIVLAIALACGLAGGILFARQKTDSIRSESVSDSTVVETLERENRTLRGEIAQLETQNEELSAQLFDATRAADAALSEGVAEADTAADAAPIDPLPEGVVRDRKRESRWNPRNAEASEEAIARINDAFGSLIQAEIDKTQDPAAIERLRALSEWRAYQDDLRRQIRESGDDPETRAALSQQMRESQDASMEILDQEQGRLMAELAQRHNIKDADTFSNEVREMLTNPLFEMQALFAGRNVLPYLQLNLGGRGRGRSGPSEEAPVQQ